MGFVSPSALLGHQSSNQPHLSIAPRLSFSRHHHHYRQNIVCLSPASLQTQTLLHTTSKPKDLNARLALRSPVVTTVPVDQKRQCDTMSQENSERATSFLNIAPIEASVADSRAIFSELCALDDPNRRKADLLHK